MKNFHLILETKAEEDELHFVAKEYEYTFKPSIHKSQYENLSDEEKKIYTPSEFCMSKEEAKLLMVDLVKLLVM